MINFIIKTFFIVSLFISMTEANEKMIIGVSSDVEISHLSKNDLKNIFLGRTTFWSNGELIHIGMSTQNPKKLNSFLIENIGQNKRRFKKYWLKKVFAGYGRAPRIFKNDKKALKFISEHENSITYLTASNNLNLDGIKVIEID